MYGIHKNLKLHFIGIGGIGMSGIAEILLNLGHKVSGSDLYESPNVIKLKNLGAEVFIGHSASNIQDVQLVVYSSAIDDNNPEVREARKHKIPLIKRAEMLAELMRLKFGIAVAGSHGKTTTTSFLATILEGLNYDQTHIIGGVVNNLGGHAKSGQGQYLLAEADESDGSFLYLNPIMSIITNIDNDHLDHYKTLDKLHDAFVEFANKVPFYGKVALNANDAQTANLLGRIKRPYLTFALEGKQKYCEHIDYLASKIVSTPGGCTFTITCADEHADFEIFIPGEHNILNALGAIVICHQLGIKLNDMVGPICHFKGVGRRLEKLFSEDDYHVIDDYGHHPTELVATLKTIREQYPSHEMITIFEPHRYTRTQNFWNEFIDSFELTDQVHILPIYAASEEAIPYIDSEIMVKAINESKEQKAYYILDREHILALLKKYRSSKSVIVTLGAGSIGRFIREALKDI